MNHVGVERGWQIMKDKKQSFTNYKVTYILRKSQQQ